jgi:hypothetical protein
MRKIVSFPLQTLILGASKTSVYAGVRLQENGIPFTTFSKSGKSFDSVTLSLRKQSVSNQEGSKKLPNPLDLEHTKSISMNQIFTYKDSIESFQNADVIQVRVPLTNVWRYLKLINDHAKKMRLF